MTNFRLALVLGAAIFAAAASGCSEAQLYRLNESPELGTMAWTNEQRENRIWRTFNYDKRQMADDWDMIWMLDRPSKLTFYPVP